MFLKDKLFSYSAMNFAKAAMSFLHHSEQLIQQMEKPPAIDPVNQLAIIKQALDEDVYEKIMGEIEAVGTIKYNNTIIRQLQGIP
jgi:hypothetical protein